MAIKPSTKNSEIATDDLTSKYVGTAYDTVMLVAQNLLQIQTIYEAVVTNGVLDLSDIAISVPEPLGIAAIGDPDTYAAGNHVHSYALPDGATAITQATNDNSTKIATTAYVTNQINDLNIYSYQGTLTVPNAFPEANAGDIWIITGSDGVIGTTGPLLEAGDTLLCILDNSAEGDYATVGSNWVIGQSNLNPDLYALLTGATFSGNVALGGNDITGVGTITASSIVGALTGNASTATKLATARAINGVNFDGSAAITVTAAAGTLSGTALKSTVVGSSLTSVGVLSALTMGGNITIPNNGTIGQAEGPLLTFDDTNNYLEITGCSVGIGISSPDSPLHIFFDTDTSAIAISDMLSSSARLVVENNNRTSDTKSSIAMEISETGVGVTRAGMVMSRPYDGTVHPVLSFVTDPASGSAIERMRIDSDGNVQFFGSELLNCQTIQDIQTSPYYHFDGVDDYVSIPDDDELNPGTNDFSIFIYKTADLSGYNRNVITKLDGGIFYIMQDRDDGTFRFRADDDTTDTSINSDSAQSGEPTGIVILGDRDGLLSMYIKGELQADTATCPPLTISNAGNLLIGVTSGITNFWNGNIGRIIFFNRLLTAEEAISLSSNPNKAIDWKDEGGSNVAMNVSDCEQGVNGAGASNTYDTFDGVSPTGFHAAVTGSGLSAVAGTEDEIIFIAGKKYGVSFSLTNNGTDLPDVSLRGAIGGSTICAETAITASDGYNNIEFTATSTTTGVVNFVNLAGETADYTVSDLDIHQLGATLNLKPQDITDDFWFDSSGNDNHGAVTGAVVGNKSRQLFEERGTWTPANGDFGTWTSPTFTATYNKQGGKVVGQLTQTGGTIDPGTVTKYITGLPYTPKYSVSGSVTNGAYADLGICSILTSGRIYFSDDLGAQTALKFSFTYETEE